MVRWLAAFLMVPVLASAQDAFQLPSGHIHCGLFDGTLRCDVLGFIYARPPPWQEPGMACRVAQAGLRCVNGDGRGFEMARARLRLF